MAQHDISASYKVYKEVKEEIKPLLEEKVGLETFINEEREKMLVLSEQKESIDKERNPLMSTVWNVDADDLYKAFNNEAKFLKGFLFTHNNRHYYVYKHSK